MQEIENKQSLSNSTDFAPLPLPSPYKVGCITTLNFRPQLAEEENQQQKVGSREKYERRQQRSLNTKYLYL